MVDHSPFRRFLMPMILALAASVTASTAMATSLDEVVTGLARDIAQNLRNRSQVNVLVESFRPPNNVGVNLQIQRRLRDALKKESKIRVLDETDLIRPNCWSVRGDYAIKTKTEPGSSVSRSRIQITARLFDEQNEQQHVIAPFPVAVSNPADVAILANATFDRNDDPSATDSSDNIDEKLTSAIARPNVSVDPRRGRIAPSDDSPFAIELLVCPGLTREPNKSDYTADASRVTKKTFRTPDGELGFAIADLRAGEIYAVRVHNDANHDVAVRLSIDGLSSFEFTEIASYRKTNHWIIPAQSSGTIYGWHRTDDYSDSFEVTHLPDTAIGRSNRDNRNVGIIQAMFFRAWTQNEPPPSKALPRTANIVDLGTKRGNAINTDYQQSRRHTDKVPLAAVAVRYNKPKDDLPPSTTID